VSFRVRPLVLLCLLGALAAPAGAQAQQVTGHVAPVDSVAPPLAPPQSQTVPPPGFRTSARQAIAIGERTAPVRALRRAHPDMRATPYVWGGWRWEIDYLAGGRILAEADVGARGDVVAVFTGPQAESYLARGHQGRFFDSPWVVLTFSLLFLFPFVDVRRLGRLLHLDLLVLLSLGVSYFFFNRGDILTSVPLVYPVLVYVLARMLWIGARPRVRRERLVPHLPLAALAVGVVLLAGGRVALNLANERIIDVGYSSVVGADRVWHKQPLYVNNDTHRDTYGPITYLSYVPFERVTPWKGLWADLPAAHSAAIAFDLLTMVGLIALGMQLRAGPRGRRLGLALAWGWAAFPFTLLGLMLNTNDGLVALLLVAALIAVTSAPARGAMLALATGAKFIPGALVPLFARGRGEERGWRPLAAFGGVFAVVIALPVALYLPDGGLREFYDTTLGYQLGRTSVFSLWGLHSGLTWLQDVFKLAAVALAVAVYFFPRGRRSTPQVAALGAAVLIAVQLPAVHWFYFYVPWFLPFVLVALFAAYSDDAEPRSEPARTESETPRVAVAA
jgi:hypothetical protein